MPNDGKYQCSLQYVSSVEEQALHARFLTFSELSQCTASSCQVFCQCFPERIKTRHCLLSVTWKALSGGAEW